LGGKSPNVIFPDADMEQAANTLGGGHRVTRDKLRRHAHVCAERVYDEFAERLEEAGEITLGNR
jgi:acyl-CoA reductase-like NAD-dependent aldehyde dehydrogenase